MDDPRRLLRYVMPGVLYGMETVVFLWIVLPTWVSSVLWPTLAGNASFGAVVGAVVVSGSLGVLFATIHHWLHWHSPTDRGILDHSKKISSLRKLGFLPEVAPGLSSDRAEALDTLTIEWWKRAGPGTVVGNATSRAVSLSDLAHSAGAARVASAGALFSVLTACAIVGVPAFSAQAIVRFAVMLLLSILAIVLFHETYRRMGEMAQRFYEGILEVALREELSRQAAQLGRLTSTGADGA